VVSRREQIIVLPEEVDIRNAADVTAELTLAASRGSVVIIDMTATRFCDCAGARAILRAHQRASDSGTELYLVATATLIRRMFDLMGVDRLLHIYPSVEAARGMMSRACLPADQAGAQQAELITFGVGEYVPAFLAGLADVGRPGPGREQAFQLGVLVTVRRADVDMQRQLARLGVSGRAQDDRRLGAAEADPRRADLDAAVNPLELDVSEHLAPESGQPLGIAAVDDQLADSACHGLTVRDLR
jgi:anti-sigma B factor antagonist